MWGDGTSPIKRIKIGWWIAVIVIAILLYTVIKSDIAFIVIAFVVAILYLFTFAAENGSMIDFQPLQVIIAWILVIALIFVICQSIGYPIVGIICGLVALVGMIMTINVIPRRQSTIAIAVVSILLVIWALYSTISTVGIYEVVVLMAMVTIAITLFYKDKLKEGLLVLALTGVIVKLG